MIEFPNGIKGLYEQPTVEFFWCIRLGDIYTTSYFTDITLKGMTFKSDGKLVAVDAPRVDSIVDRQNFEVTLTDVDFDLGNTAETMIGKPVEVLCGLVDQETSQPLLSEYITVYKGAVDGAKYSIDTSAYGSALLHISCSSPMHNLDLKRSYFTSQDSLDKSHPGDTSYIQVYIGSNAIDMKWGKA